MLGNLIFANFLRLSNSVNSFSFSTTTTLSSCKGDDLTQRRFLAQQPERCNVFATLFRLVASFSNISTLRSVKSRRCNSFRITSPKVFYSPSGRLIPWNVRTKMWRLKKKTFPFFEFVCLGWFVTVTCQFLALKPLNTFPRIFVPDISYFSTFR